MLYCTVNYGEYPVYFNYRYPKMIWTTDSGDVVYYERPTPTPLDYENSVSTFPITSSAATAYRCGVTFTTSNENPPPIVATNTPYFSASCTIASEYTCTLNQRCRYVLPEFILPCFKFVDIDETNSISNHFFSCCPGLFCSNF